MSLAGPGVKGRCPDALASGRPSPRRTGLRPAAPFVATPFAAAPFVAALFVAGLFASACLDTGAAAGPCGAFVAPAPSLLRALALGHERALARLLWSRARVAHGACFARRQRFEGATAYVDAVRALDPSFREPYRYVAAFVASAPGQPSLADLAFARRVLDEGARRFPDDSELVERAGAPLRLSPLADNLGRPSQRQPACAHSCTTTREPGCSADDCTPCQPAGRGGSDQRKRRLASRGARLTQPWLCWRPKLSCQKAPCRAYDSK